jgi:NADH:ubiquinone oxidoreductase subunit 5 (subunit L)/multisubunit Na+/H+ antiporter MnhA subunit
VVKAGFYLTVRLWLGPFQALLDEALLTLLGLLGAAAILWGALKALQEERIKLIVAYSTVSQLGYLFLIFPLIAAHPLAAWSGAFYHVLAHGTAKAAVFLAAGNVLYGLKAATIRSVADLGLPLRMSLLAFALAGSSVFASMFAYVSPGREYLLWLAIIAWFIFITYDILKKFRGQAFLASHWHIVKLISTLAFFLVLVHSLGMGRDLQSGPLRWLWIFYGVSAAAAAVYTYIIGPLYQRLRHNPAAHERDDKRPDKSSDNRQSDNSIKQNGIY